MRWLNSRVHKAGNFEAYEKSILLIRALAFGQGVYYNPNGIIIF